MTANALLDELRDNVFRGSRSKFYAACISKF